VHRSSYSIGVLIVPTKNALRDAVVSSTPSPGHQKLYDETLSITNNWVNDLEGAANRKRPRSTPSPEKAVKHRKISGGPHGAIMQPTMTEDPAVIEGPLTAEDPTITSPAFPPAKGDARAEFSALLAMDAEEQALPSRRAVADVWNIQAIEEMTSRYLQENPAIQEQARRYLANSYHARTLHHLRIASQLLNDSS